MNINVKKVKKFVRRMESFAEEWWGSFAIAVLVSAWLAFMATMRKSFENGKHSVFGLTFYWIFVFVGLISLSMVIIYLVWEGWNLIKHIRDWSYRDSED